MITKEESENLILLTQKKKADITKIRDVLKRIVAIEKMLIFTDAKDLKDMIK